MCMKRLGRKTFGIVVLGAAALCVAQLPAAHLADVYLKSGIKLRGEVTTTDDAVIVKNAAGQMRLPRGDVERIVPVDAASRPATSQPAAPTSAASHPTPPSPPTARPELAPAPPLPDEDIQRLKIAELRLAGRAESVRVRFLRKGKQRDLPAQVLEELQERPDHRPEWEEVLARGQPQEKLQLIARETDAEHVDRIVIENDPEVFATFRRRVLPLVDRSCARSGCHGGHTARVFRFPAGSPSSDTYVYTTFVLLDQMETKHGPLLDRENPEGSLLLYYLLPPKADEKGHPPVGRGPTFLAVIRDRDDRSYGVVLDWIHMLRVPHPAYGLTHENPYAGQPATLPKTQAEEPNETRTPSAPTTGPADDSGS
jgi:hypothetical protein